MLVGSHERHTTKHELIDLGWMIKSLLHAHLEIRLFRIKEFEFHRMSSTPLLDLISRQPLLDLISMVQLILTVLAVTACVSITNGLGTFNMANIITGNWIQPKVQNLKSFVRTTNNTVTQRVDNFDLQNVATFEQRYFSHDDHFRAGGPIYVILGSQRPVSEYDLSYALITSVARSEGGIVFVLENRYYGHSIPVS